MEIPCLLLYFDRFPIPSKIQFEIHIEAKDEETRKNLRILSLTRNEMIETIKMHDSQETIKKINEYLRYLNGFIISSKKTVVQTIGPLRFTWNSVFEKDATRDYIAYSYKFDLIMCLISLAFAHLNFAQEQFQKTKEVIPIIETLRLAASILDRVVQIDIPCWKTIPKERPLETEVQLLEKMVPYVLATAQMIAIKKTSEANRGKLEKFSQHSMFVYKTCDEMALALEKSQSYQEHGSNIYWNFFTIQYICYAIITQYFQAKLDKEETKHGIACDRMNYCVENLLPRIKEFQKTGHLTFYNEKIELFADQCIEYKESIEKENSLVYYDKLTKKFQDFPKERTQCVNLGNAFELPDPAFENISTK